MNFKQIFNPKGTNYWIIAMAFAANLLLAFFILLFSFVALDFDVQKSDAVQVGLMLAFFIGPFMVGWISGWIAFDDRGPTYGVLGSLGSVIAILVTLLASGVFAILIAIVAIAGGFNGGTLSRSRSRRK